jgi:aryl-alcohol dehydrogenase-like predicted oxidoreductase
MEYRTLGRSGCSVSSLCLGTMTFGAETDEAGAHEQLDLFVEAGGTLVDTADVYSAGASEQIIGRWLSSRPSEVRDRVVLATKGRFPLSEEPNALGSSRRHLRRALDDSLRRLGVEHVDLYQLHAWDPHTPLEESLRFLDDAVRAGKISYPGLSNFTGWQVQRAVDLAEREHLAVPVTLQPSYSLLVRGIEFEIVPACQHNGLGLLPWGPLGGGWLSGKYTGISGRAAAPGWAITPGAVSRPTNGSACVSARGTCWRPCRTSPRGAAHPWHRSRWPGWSPGRRSPR